MIAFPSEPRTRLLLSLGSAGLLLVGLIAIAGCREVKPQVIPEGVHTFTGVLLPTEITLTRRGTHILQVDDEPLYYVESSKVNLRAFEGKRVAVRGTVRRNVDPSDNPVLIAESVVPSTDPSLRAWSVPVLGVTVETPKEWIGMNEAEGIKFFLGQSGNLLLRIHAEKSEALPYIFRTAALKQANRSLTVAPILIGSTRAVRLVDSRDDSQHISFEHNTGVVIGTGSIKDIVTFSYTPDSTEEEALSEEFLAVVHSLVFSRAQQSSSSRSSAASAARSSRAASKSGGTTSSSTTTSSTSGPDGTPCGGPAGILCAPGQYCEVTDLSTNIGKCKKL